MLNNQYGEKEMFGSGTQILADTHFVKSVGCRVPKSLGIVEDGKTIVKAGTPLRLTLTNLLTPASLATGSTAMNAVLLHDVDVTIGENNGTAVLFGFINIKNIDSVTAAKLTTAAGASTASPLIEVLSI